MTENCDSDYMLSSCSDFSRRKKFKMKEVLRKTYFQILFIVLGDVCFWLSYFVLSCTCFPNLQAVPKVSIVHRTSLLNLSSTATWLSGLCAQLFVGRDGFSFFKFLLAALLCWICIGKRFTVYTVDFNILLSKVI